MTATTTTPMIWDLPEYLGCIHVMRPTEVVPRTIHVSATAPRRRGNSTTSVRYTDASGDRINLGTSDRRIGQAVMEDDTAVRLAALRAALLADGWTDVVERG